MKITYHRGRVDHEDFGSDDDENDGGGGGQSKPLPPSSPSTPGEESPQQQQHNNTKNKIKQSSIIIATASLDRLCREWQYSELTLPNCVFTIHTLPSSGWDLARLTEMIWRPLTRLSHVRSVHSRGEGEGSGDGGGRAGELFHPVTIVDRTKVFEGIAFPKSERSKLREKLWRRWDQNLKKRARKGAEQRSELALLRRPGRYGRTGRWWDDEESGLEVGKMAERLVREMMKEGNEEEKKLDLGYFLEEVAREQQEGGLI